MMRKIHTVRSPFLCREGQFGSGRKLVIGIALKAIEKTTKYQFKIKNRPTIYTGNSMEIIEKAHLWKNNKGKIVCIIPIDIFKKEE
jgi:hypothetical protein